MDTLTLVYKQKKGKFFEGGAYVEHRNYIDFVVSGQSLGQLFDIERMNLIGTFGWIKNQAIELNLIDEFLGKSIPELPTGRSSFYVCKECGEIECGAITAG